MRPALAIVRMILITFFAAVTDQLSLSHTSLNLKRKTTRLLLTISSEGQLDNHEAGRLTIHFAIGKIIGSR